MQEDMVALLIPILGIVFGIGVAIVSIIAGHRQRMQRVELRHKERLAAMEKGLELPPDLKDLDDGSRRSRSGSLRSGLIWLGVGIVLYFAIEGVAGDDVALFGLIPAVIGLATLIFYFIEGRKNANGNGGTSR